MVFAQPRIQENETHSSLRGFEIQMNQLISARRPELVRVKIKKSKQKITPEYWTLPSTFAADHRVKSKGEKRDKYVGLETELKNLWNMNVTVIQIMVCALWTIHEGLEKGQENLEIRGQGETRQTTAL